MEIRLHHGLVHFDAVWLLSEGDLPRLLSETIQLYPLRHLRSDIRFLLGLSLLLPLGHHLAAISRLLLIPSVHELLLGFGVCAHLLDSLLADVIFVVVHSDQLDLLLDQV